jgi:hypothetical protein
MPKNPNSIQARFNHRKRPYCYRSGLRIRLLLVLKPPAPFSDEGIEVTLINSNPATIMTDKVVADNIYLQPLEAASYRRKFLKQHPSIDAVLPTMGGQTALEPGYSMRRNGSLGGSTVLIWWA